MLCGYREGRENANDLLTVLRVVVRGKPVLLLSGEGERRKRRKRGPCFVCSPARKAACRHFAARDDPGANL